MQPIFIVGTERSGTNLLRLILNSHSNIAIPHPPHIVRNFSKLEPLYGDLRDDHKFRELIKEVVRIVELHPYPWEILIDKDEIFNSARERNLINIFFAIYEQYLKSTDKKRWGCKSTFMLNHISSVRRYYPQAKFIYMVRDGRDVAVSARHSIFNRYSLYYIAKLWRKEQQTGIYWLNKLSKDNIFLLRYEDLLIRPKETIYVLCSFLKEPYEEDMLNFFKTREAEKSSNLSAAWKNTAMPIIKNNSEKFKTELSKKEVKLFEAIAARELDYFSYKLANPSFISETTPASCVKFRINYLLEDVLRMLSTQIKHLFTDKNNFLRCKKFLFLKFIQISRGIKWSWKRALTGALRK